jgi:hypothetical protein
MCSDTPPPDPAIGQAAKDNIQLGREALSYYREKDAAAKPRQDKLDAIAIDLANQQIDTSKVNTAAAREQLDRYRTTGVAAEDAMYRDAATYDTTARQEDEAGKAATDVDFAMDSAMDTKRRTMARAGVNPADGRALSMEQDAATAGALGKAAAMNGARTKVKDMGIMLRKDAANFARGMSSSAAQTYGVAGMAGAGATGAMTAAAQQANQGTAMMGQGFGLGMQGNSSGASILNQEYNAQVSGAAASGSQTASMAGTVASIGIAI